MYLKKMVMKLQNYVINYLATSLLTGLKPIPESVLFPSFNDGFARSHLNAAFTLVHFDTFAFISVIAL